MPNLTPNLSLKKPLKTEKYTITDVTNENADILDSAINGKQATLVSGTNIKTINSTSLLGSGDLELLPKNNPISTGLFDLQGGQIKFPATQVPSSDPNTLDDYEEGTFNVYMYDAETGGNVSPTTSVGRYTKIGNLVFVSFGLGDIVTTGMTPGNIFYFELPFKSDSNIGSYGSCLNDSINYGSGKTMLVSVVLANKNRFFIRACGSGALDTTLTVSSITSGTSDFFISLTYFAI